MPQSNVCEIMHIVFSTRDRFPMLSDEMRPQLHAVFGGILKRLRCKLIKAGGISDHVHVLAAIHATLSISTVVQKLKANSTRWMRSRSTRGKKFGWQKGYAAFSVSVSQIGRVKDYIENQSEHHRKRCFKDELRFLLNAHGVEFEEEHLWD